MSEQRVAIAAKQPTVRFGSLAFRQSLHSCFQIHPFGSHPDDVFHSFTAQLNTVCKRNPLGWPASSSSLLAAARLRLSPRLLPDGA